MLSLRGGIFRRTFLSWYRDCIHAEALLAFLFFCSWPDGASHSVRPPPTVMVGADTTLRSVGMLVLFRKTDRGYRERGFPSVVL